MSRDHGVLAAFEEPAVAARAVTALHQAGFADVRAAMPAPYPEVVAALSRPRSTIGWMTLLGCLLGAAAGLALYIGTALAMPYPTGGKATVSIPPVVVIGFETTVLFGAGMSLGAISLGEWAARRNRGVPRDPRFTCDRIGVFVPHGPEDARAEQILREAGAEEVHRVA